MPDAAGYAASMNPRSLALVALAALPAAAAPDPRTHAPSASPPELVLPAEDVPVDRWGEGSFAHPSPPRASFSVRGTPYVQANVGPSQANIAGDAANEPSIAIDPTARNRIVIGWRQFDTIASNFREAGYASSRDGGRTWTKGEFEPGVFRSDPVLRANGDGVIFYNMVNVDASNNFRCDYYRSADGGRTWSGPTFAFGGDKLWYAIDRTNGPGRGFIYQWWNTAGNNYFPNQFNRSIDGGLTFQTPIQIPIQIVFGTLAIDSAGGVYLAGRISGGATPGIHVVRSTNANNTGVTPTFTDLTPAALPMGGSFRFGSAGSPNPGGLLNQVQIAVDTSGGPRNGWIYVLSSMDPAGTDPLDAFFARSTDGGSTWSAPVKLNTDAANANAWQWFSTMSIAPNGRLDVVWNDTRESLAANISRLYHRASSDGGTTWSSEQALTPPFDSYVGYPQQNKLGDYYDMESDNVGSSLAFAATFNGEQDVYFFRIGDHDCDGNGVGDATQIAGNAALDCNANAILDACEIAAGTFADRNADLVLDVCQCVADVDDGSGTGTQDATVDIADLLHYLTLFAAGSPDADVDDGSGTGQLDQATDISDLLYFLARFDAGC